MRVNARLAAQLAHVREETPGRRAEVARAMSPEERLRVAHELCVAGAPLVQRLPEATRLRVRQARRGLTPAAEDALRRLSRLSRPP